MVLTPTPLGELGWEAQPFQLPGVDGLTYALEGIAGPRATVVMFICNHCPYVVGIVERLVTDMEDLIQAGIGVAAICSNDADRYPADSFPKMREFSDQHGFGFPYLRDEDQSVARAYGAVCTPDFFGFDADLNLRYRGRLDAAGRNPRQEGVKRELVDAMLQVAEIGRGPEEQAASMGCSIKWNNG